MSASEADDTDRNVKSEEDRKTTRMTRDDAIRVLLCDAMRARGSAGSALFFGPVSQSVGSYVKNPIAKYCT